MQGDGRAIERDGISEHDVDPDDGADGGVAFAALEMLKSLPGSGCGFVHEPVESFCVGGDRQAGAVVLRVAHDRPQFALNSLSGVRPCFSPKVRTKSSGVIPTLRAHASSAGSIPASQVTMPNVSLHDGVDGFPVLREGNALNCHGYLPAAPAV